MFRAPLPLEFRYIHEPLPVGDPAIPVLGHEALTTALKERLTYSHGGAFLITGFRGVGKSTMVLRALTETAASWGRKDRLLVVHLNVARTMTAERLLFAVVRRVFEALHDDALLEQLPREVRQSLLLAYSRTSLSFTQTQSESSERGGTAGMAPKQGVLSPFVPTLSVTGSRTRSQAMEAAFLAYSETDVEHDLIRIVHLLNGTEGRAPSAERRGLRALRRRTRERLRVHPVVVLDEVDKLTDNRLEAIEEFEELLGRLKNVLTVRGAHFLVVAGPDLHDRAVRDVERGNGVYESVFSWRAYVPCLWEASERLVHRLTGNPPAETPDGSPVPCPAQPATPQRSAAALVNYLQYKARGVPRRLLHEFNALVRWEAARAYLHVGSADWERIDFYSDLQQIIAVVRERDGLPGSAAVPIDDDRHQLGAYHVTDWVLRSRGRPFTTADVVTGTDSNRLDPLLNIETAAVDRLLGHLAEAGILDRLGSADPEDVTQYGVRLTNRELDCYKLSDDHRQKLADLARRSEPERRDLGVDHLTSIVSTDSRFGRAGSPGASDRPGPNAPAPLLGTVDNSRYELRELIGRGGMGTVYRGQDRLTGQEVAIKIMHSAMLDDAELRARFAREGALGQRLRHRQIARILDVLDDLAEPAIVMELIEGPSLTETVTVGGPLDAKATAGVARQLGEALLAVERAGMARIDLKPSNIILHPARGAIVVDLGLVRLIDDAGITHTGMVVGSPAFLAPEQATGGTVGIKSDVFSLGVVAYYCLLGRSPWQDSGTMLQTLYRVVHEDVPVGDLPVSPGLRQLVRESTARDMELRPSPEEFLSALSRTPEGSAESAS